MNTLKLRPRRLAPIGQAVLMNETQPSRHLPEARAHASNAEKGQGLLSMPTKRLSLKRSDTWAAAGTDS